MAARIQQLVMGLGKGKQTDIVTASISANFLRFMKINMDLTTPEPVNENDAPEIGKGHEFATQTFPSHYNVANRIEKYASAEFVAWTVAYALGHVVESGTTPNFILTVTPIDPGTTLELPYFSVVEQVPEGGGAAVDNLFVGCAIEEFVHTLTYGPGRASSKMTVSWVGSGKVIQPSAITVPALTTDHNMLAGSMTMTANGIDLVGAKRILSTSVGWKNNFLLGPGFYPGSGLQGNYQIRGRMEIGPRVSSLQFSARLLATSTEYALLVAQTAGSTVLSVAYDANNMVTYTFPQLAYSTIKNGETDGLVDVTITGTPEYATSGGVFSAVCKMGLTGIAQ
jgi:hypothetical protein